MGKGTMVNHFDPPSNESDKVFNRFLRARLAAATASLHWYSHVWEQESRCKECCVGLPWKLRGCVLALMKLKVKRTVDATGARKMVLKIVNISCHIFQADK